MIDHGLYYVDRAGGPLLRLDDDNPIDLPGARLYVLQDALDRAVLTVTRDVSAWGPIGNLGQAEFDAAKDDLRPGVYYRVERTYGYESTDRVVLLSGGLFPWKTQGDEKPNVLSLLRFAQDKVGSAR